MCTLLTLVIEVSNAQPAPRKATNKSVAAKHHSKSKHRAKKSSWKHRGQQAIAPDRAREIQQALIREHYLTGEPTGVWDSGTQAAMVRYQADHGWQNKVTPDSRALIKLGLGPDYSQQQVLNLPGQTDAVATASAGSGSAGSSNAARDKQ
jgi:Putative peptidoglycan binding domain